MQTNTFFPVWLKKFLAAFISVSVGLAPVAAGASVNNVIELAVSAKIARKIAQDLLARQAAYILAMESVVDTDGFPLPPAMGGGVGPVGGGLVPSGSAAPKADGYGISLGYCAWDHGTVTNHAGRLAGANNMSAVALAIVSSGSNNSFDTTCAQIASGAGAQGDDYVVSYSAGQISAGVAGGTNMGMAVGTYADLVALPVTALTDGQVRLVKDSNTLYSYSTGTGVWTSVSATATWASISGKPTTLSGYGITDAVPAARTLTAGAGLTGGGDMSADRSFALASSGVTAGAYGSGTVVPVVTVDAYGRITSASTTTVTPAWASITGKPTTLAGYGITDAVPAARAILPGAGVLINGSNLVGQTLGGADVTVSLENSGVTAGTYGSASTVPVLTVDAYGRVTSATTSAVTVGWGAVTGKPTTIAGYGITDAVSLSDIDKRIGVGGAVSNATLTDSPSGTGTNLMVGNGVAKTLASVTSGTQNVAVGPLALRSVTAGGHNIAIGYSAGEYTTDGGWNIFIGEQAGYNNIGANGSVAIGWQSMYNAYNTGAYYDAYNTAVGFQAMRGSPDPTQNSGKNNTGIGAFALTQYTSGQYNTAVGMFSLYSLSSGLYNTGVGSGALGSATTSWFNAAFGYNAMASNVSASRNVAVGPSAMEYRSSATGFGDTLNTAVGSQAFSGKSANQAVNTGTSNTAVGGQALYSGTTGSNNVAIGVNAGYAIEGGDANVLIGNDAGSTNVAGSRITAIGYQAMRYANNTATPSNFLNTAVGYQALMGNSNAAVNTGNFNTALGSLALWANESGSNNTAIGTSAGGALTTGGRNVAIGSNALSSSASATSDSVAVGFGSGYLATGDGNTSVGSYSLYGTFPGTVNGVMNAAFGMSALRANTTGTYNVSVGADSLRANTGGTSNTAIGYGAAYSNVAGNGNTAVGFRSMYYAYDTSTPTLMLNTAIGYKSMEMTNTPSSNSGTRNTAVGANALQQLTSGQNNVAVGVDSGTNIQTSTDNVVIGAGSGRYLTGSYNVALGSAALTGNATTTFGAGNVAIGYGALTGASGFTNNYNISVGYEAGRVTTGGGNIFIGKGAGKTASGDSSTGNVIIGSWDPTPTAYNDRIYFATGGSAWNSVDGKLAAQFVYSNSPASGNGWTIYGSQGSTGALSCNYYTGTSWSCSSDARLKENVSTMVPEAVLDRFMAVRPVNYNFIGAKTKSVGFIAQELQPLFPDMVATGANGYLTVTYTDMIPVITAVVQNQQRQIQALQDGKLDNAVNAWSKASDGSARLMFAKDAETRIRGYGPVVLDVRNGGDQSVAKFGADGNLELAGSVRLTGTNSALEFLKGALKVSAWADDSVDALVVAATRAARAAVQLRGEAGQLYAGVYGDASGFGVSDGDGRNWITGARTESGMSVSIPGAVALGDSAGSRLNLAHGQSMSAGQDAAGAFVRFDAGEVRVVDPKTKQDVIRLGSDGLVQAKKFAPTEVVQSWSACAGQESHIARDEQGHVVVCER